MDRTEWPTPSRIQALRESGAAAHSPAASACAGLAALILSLAWVKALLDGFLAAYQGLYGAPGQDRFDFMWDILLEQAKAAIVLVNHAAPHPERDLALYMRNIAERLGQRPLPLVVGVTHADRQPDRPLSIYDDCLIPPPHVPAHSRVPLLQLDARDRAQVRALVMAAVGLLEQSRTATA